MNRRIVPIVLVAAALLLFTIGVANATLITTNILRSWDDGLNRYENGNLTMWLNNDRQPFYTKLDFNNDLHADACGTGTSSQWAGDAVIGLYHTDNSPLNAQGFQNSGNWKLVKCSTFDTNKYPAAADILATCVVGNPGDPVDKGCVLKTSPDAIVTCTTGNCLNEIETQFHVNIDPGDGVNAATKCDGTIDAPFLGVWSSNPTSNNLCMYWDAQKPAKVSPYWGGNIQVRYGTGVGGDKTINFNQLLGPNAVSVSRLAATADGLRGSLVAWAMGLVLVGAAVFVWRRKA